MAERIPDAPAGWEKTSNLHFRHTATGLYLSTRNLKCWGEKTIYEVSLTYGSDHTPHNAQRGDNDWFQCGTKFEGRFFTERGFPPAVFEWALKLASSASNAVLTSARHKRDTLDHAIERKEWRS